jgi:hypothetical protein
MSSVCCSCKSNKTGEDVLDPTSLDGIKIENKKRNRKNVKPIDELNISHNGIKNKKELAKTNFNCFSFFDVCYTNDDDDVKRVKFNSDYGVASISE